MLTDEEVICTWMAGISKPTTEPEEALDLDLCGSPLNTGSGWWECHCCWEDGDVPKWYPRRLTLNALWEVEAKLIECDPIEGAFVVGDKYHLWQAYTYHLSRAVLDSDPISVIHASAEQKIKALATVLRPIVEGKAA